METITNAVNSVSTTVSNAIYGTGNETGGAEPVSGVKGQGTATDPYDKGNDANLNPSTSAHTNPTTTTTSSTTTSDTPSTNAHSSDTNTTATPSTSSTDANTAGHSTATSAPHVTGPGPEGQERPSAGSRSGDIRPTEANENRPNTNVGGFGTAEPSVSADPASGQKPQQKQQGGDRPLDEPTGEQVQAVKQEKKEGEAAQEGKDSSKTGLGEERDGQRHPRNDEEREKMAEKGELPKDPNDHSGEPMKMHDGSESDVSKKPGEEGKTDKEGEGGETDRKKSVGQEGGQPHGSAKGTGEEWVKTSGFDAEGGDFDATKPGAGKEATRLLEEKGIHRENGDSANDAHIENTKGGDAGKQKTSTISKLKDKLHLGTGKNLDN